MAILAINSLGRELTVDMDGTVLQDLEVFASQLEPVAEDSSVVEISGGGMEGGGCLAYPGESPLTSKSPPPDGRGGHG